MTRTSSFVAVADSGPFLDHHYSESALSLTNLYELTIEVRKVGSDSECSPHLAPFEDCWYRQIIHRSAGRIQKDLQLEAERL
jgi:hypothetical protein